jgi:hypothetical protein
MKCLWSTFLLLGTIHSTVSVCKFNSTARKLGMTTNRTSLIFHLLALWFFVSISLVQTITSSLYGIGSTVWAADLVTGANLLLQICICVICMCSMGVSPEVSN